MITKYASLIKKHAPSWLYKLGAQAWIDYTFPRHLFIETTASCNLSCSYCPREKINKHMDWWTFTNIIDEASKYGTRSFSLHLFGEPLLYPKIFDAIRYIKTANRIHTVLLTTNGTLIERNGNLDKLISSGVDQVLWSWRPEAKFSEETKERLRQWGKFRVRFINEVVPDSEREAWQDWPNKEERPLHNYGGNVDLNQFQSKEIHQQEKSGDLIRWPCYHLWLAPAVAWNGNFLLCCADPHQQEILGNVKEIPIASLWQSQKLRDIREGQLAGQYGGICKGCDVWKSYPDIWFKWQKQS